jgi:hypothetical protein
VVGSDADVMEVVDVGVVSVVAADENTECIADKVNSIELSVIVEQ